MRIKILAILPFLLLLGGCYDYKETDNMAIVSGLHVAKGTEENYRLTFEIVGIEQSENSEKAIVTAKEGRTIADAIDNATALSGKKLYFGHAQVLAIDYELAKEGVGDILDYFTRQNDMRLTMNVAVSKGMSGEDFFKSEEGDVRTFALTDMLKANEERAITPDIELYSFVRDEFEMGKDGCLPVVGMGKDGKIVLDTAAVFADEKLIGELGSDDTKYLMLLENIGERGGFILERQEGSPVSFEIRSRKAEIKPRLENGRLICDVDFKAQLGVLELTGNAGVLNPEKLSDMENELEKYVFEQIHAVLRRMVEESPADLLGIERELVRNEPRMKSYLAENFPQLYSDAHFNLNVDISVIDSGRLLRKLDRS